MSSTPIDFPAAIDFEMFALFLEARRIHRRMTPRRLARVAGVEVDDLRRAANGRNPGEDVFVALCDWMGEPAATFVKTERVHG